MTEPRRLPAPWSIIEHSESFEIQAANDQNLAYVYFEDENASAARHGPLDAGRGGSGCGQHREAAGVAKRD